jgi:virginiamycin B lyase
MARASVSGLVEPAPLAGVAVLLAALFLSDLALAPRAEAFIYWANRTDAIGRANLDGTGVDERFVARSKRGAPEGVAVDAHHIYWSEAYALGGGAIGRAKLDGTGVDRKFIRIRTNTPIGVAVDANHVYWSGNCCRSGFLGGAIGRANLDGTDVEQGFIPATDGPALDVSVDATHVYWTKGVYSTPGAIRRANLDGTGVDEDFITDVRAPAGIAVDAAHIYWTEDSPPTIGRANVDGTGVNQNFIADFTFGADALSDVEVGANHIYWADQGVVAFTGAIGRANLDGTGFDPDFITPKRRPTPVAVAVDGLTDTRIAAKVSARQSQCQKGQKIRVRVKVRARERLTASGSGNVTLKPRSYKLKPKQIHLTSGETKTLTLRPRRSGAEKRIARALDRGRKVSAKLRVELADRAGNTRVVNANLRLKG